MSNEKFTQGDWQCRDNAGYVEIKNGEYDICTLYGLCWTASGKQITCEGTMRDAHLIATAPDMYRALQKCKRTMLDAGFREGSVAVMRIDAALAKADGDQE